MSDWHLFRGDYGGVVESVEQGFRHLRSGPGTLTPFGGWGARGAVFFTQDEYAHTDSAVLLGR